MSLPHLVAARRAFTALAAAAAAVALTGVATNASTPGADVRLTNDQPGGTGYVSNYNVNNPGSPVSLFKSSSGTNSLMLVPSICA